jgi:hypothetical protein
MMLTVIKGLRIMFENLDCGNIETLKSPIK